MQDGSILRVMSLDPGSDTMGMSILDYEYATGNIYVIESFTHHGSIMMRKDEELIYGSMQARLFAHQRNLIRLIQLWDVDVVVSESAYFKRFPLPFAVLIQVVDNIINAARITKRPYYGIDPSTIKKSVGAHASKHNKDEVKEKLLTIPNMIFQQRIPFEFLDEHSSDSIAVGYCFIKMNYMR